MNLPNQLTVGRLYLTAAFLIALSVPFGFRCTVALGFFLCAAFTDYLDGYLARRDGLVTTFGQLMDPLIDKIMTATAFVGLVSLQAVPGWVAAVVIGREFLVTGLRLLATARVVVLPAEAIGKYKTVWQIVTVAFFLAVRSAQELGTPGFPPRPGLIAGTVEVTGWLLAGGAVLLTVVSGAAYLHRHRFLWQDEMNAPASLRHPASPVRPLGRPEDVAANGH